MNTNNLYLEYARVIELCKGTALEDTPWLGVKFSDSNISRLRTHPNFLFPNGGYEFLVAILEDKPVFVGDVLYSKIDGEAYKISLLSVTTELVSLLSWQPPKPKRTINLNGVDLPCPDNNEKYSLVIGVGEVGYTSYDPISIFRFNKDDASKVYNTLCDILEKAKKEY